MAKNKAQAKTKPTIEEPIDEAYFSLWKSINEYVFACNGYIDIDNREKTRAMDYVKNSINNLGGQVFIVGPRLEVGQNNVFKTYKLALKALEEKRKEILHNSFGNIIPEIKDGEFTFMTGGWESTSVTWKIYPIVVHNNVKESGFIYDAVAEKLRREAEQKRRELEAKKRKEAFINTLTPEQRKELGVLFGEDDDDWRF